jgi:squalene-hopene/tetraprenyl-beta-curcumene cyclase
VDDGLKIWERFSPRPLRKRAIEAARLWLEERLSVPGGLGGIYPAMANSVLALRLLGYPDDHPLILGSSRRSRRSPSSAATSSTTSPAPRRCGTPRWPPTRSSRAICARPSRLMRAAEWMLSKQVALPGDWQVKRPHVQPGGWAFQYDNPYYPDLDDTGHGPHGAREGPGLDADRTRLAKERGLGWFLGMQNQDGGWASFDADNNRIFLNNIPFADHGALLDPVDRGPDRPRPRAARHARLRSTSSRPSARSTFIRHSQRHDGPWYGRWGVNYIYGTWSVLRGLRPSAATRGTSTCSVRCAG